MDGVKQQKKQHKSPWLAEYSWKPGQSGNPNGRPQGKTLKEWAREFLLELPDDEKLEFLKELPADIVWKMAEGQPHITHDITSGGLPIPILGNVHSNDSNKEDSSPQKEN